MNILFISQYYPPEIGAASNRIGYFAKFLSRNGHNVTVLTSTPNYPEGKVYPGYENRFSIKEEDSVCVTRTRILLTPKKTVVTRLAHYLSFLLSSIFAKGKIQKSDIIFASSPPLFTAIIAVIFKKLWNIPLMTDIRDIWPESAESVGLVKNRKLIRSGEKLAQWIYRNSNHIMVTSPGIKRGVPQIFHEKITVLPNGAELELFHPDVDGEMIRRKWNLGEEFVVLYTGNLGLAQAPEILIKVAELLKNESDIIFLIVGAGVLYEKLRSEVEQKNLTNIVFPGARPRSEMPTYVAASDVCIIPYKKSETFRNTLPSKMFDYMAGGKPIIINLDGEAGDLIQQAQCGLVVKEENASDLAEKIQYLKQNPSRAQQMGCAGRTFVEKNYRRETVAAHLEELLKSIAKE